MKKYQFAVHYDMVINVEVMADNEQEAAQIAKEQAARLPMEAAECVEQDAQPTEDPQELSEREVKRMENEKVMEFVADYVEQQTPTEVHDIAEGYGVNWLEWTGDDETAFYNDLFHAISSCEHPRTAIFERYSRMYARRRWEQVADDLRAQWAKAFSKARREPKDYRVIVETNEREEETGDGDRYFMIDKSDGCGNEYDRWQVIRCDCAASPYDTRTAKAYTVGTEAQPSCEASPTNVTRWAERMINAGRVVSIYADCY